MSGSKENKQIGELNKMTHPPINQFGAVMICRDLLMWTKANAEADSVETFISKMNRPNWINRIMWVMMSLNRYGPTLAAAQKIQNNGNGFFNDVTAEALAEKLEDAVAALKSGGSYKFRDGEFGELDFSNLSEETDDDTDDDEEEETEEE
jgi:hypothetical protein